MLGLLFLSLLATRADEMTKRVSTIRVPGASKVFKAQSGADGTIHLLFDSDDGPQCIKSHDSGLAFSAPITVVDAAMQKPSLKFSAWDLAVGSDCRLEKSRRPARVECAAAFWP